MSEVMRQHERWSSASERLRNSPAPAARADVKVVRKVVLSPQIIAIREKRRRFDQAMREALSRGLSATVGARFVTDETELEEFLKSAVVPAWRRIATEVAEKHNVNLIDLVSHRRDRKSCKARHEAFWRIKAETTMSLPQIGRKFGGRDHTTVLHGIKKHEQRMMEAGKESVAGEIDRVFIGDRSSMETVP